ncbi:alkyl hydroperoxide reductase/ thiol specific antioxidant/ Mal allergen [Rhodopirellula maiorica SM1]|uniref:Alkyl hydroperoxide reductase/ thiol specific antioxidant/ Mal allergen n=1 Tax=Rhodopirellula maiorica SM1 TaxID=1265738 RepID=M5S2S5_9BACT|nr:thioredoxin family protein [Rhodopirellula maiorica]EMI20489.1 alkyl hydroperoxide reductase/ thiol specific antioxidant/ Mal allergen [Rhodopirellula maiorica SM1]
MRDPTTQLAVTAFDTTHFLETHSPMPHKRLNLIANSFALVLLAFICSFTVIHAGEFNPMLDIGDTAVPWKELPGTDDKLHSLADLKDQKIVVVAFTCNSCPYAVDAEDRLIALQQKFADKDVAVVAINVNKVDEDLMPAMKQRVAEKKFNFPYLFDASQQIAKEYGAKYTPEVFVLDQNRKIVYMGSMDDSPDGKNVTEPHVIRAIQATLAGEQPAVRETVPIGCRIRFERNLRNRSR